MILTGTGFVMEDLIYFNLRGLVEYEYNRNI
jgi:hypothetical protein